MPSGSLRHDAPVALPHRFGHRGRGRARPQPDSEPRQHRGRGRSSRQPLKAHPLSPKYPLGALCDPWDPSKPSGAPHKSPGEPLRTFWHPVYNPWTTPRTPSDPPDVPHHTLACACDPPKSLGTPGPAGTPPPVALVTPLNCLGYTSHIDLGPPAPIVTPTGLPISIPPSLRNMWVPHGYPR